MAFHANAFGAGAKFRVGWMLDTMIAVTYDASGQIKRRKCFIVRTLPIHLGLEDVTVRANILDFVDARRHGAARAARVAALDALARRAREA